MKVGITGGKGFIGSHILNALKQKKGVSLSAFDLPKQSLLKLADLKRFVRNKDIIIHAAAVNRGSATDIIANSVAGTYNLVAAVSAIKNKPKLIFLSSVQAQSDTVYGLSKRLAEIMLKDFSERFRTPVTIFRIANVFGEGIKPFRHSVIATFSYQLQRGERLKINKDGQKFSFVYVRDLAALIAREAFRRRRPLFHFQHINSRDIFTVPKIANLLIRFSKSRPPVKLKTRFEKNLYRTYLSFSK